MRTTIGALILLLATDLVYGQTNWYHFGDTLRTSPRPSHDISNFFILEGPGNENPGNYRAFAPSSPGGRFSPQLAGYIAQQFTYVLFDMDSFAERERNGGRVTRMMTPVYHQEARRLMDSSSRIIVLPYFCFTMTHPAFPWYSSIAESLMLHQPGFSDSTHRVRAVDGNFFMMDVRNAAWKNRFIAWIERTVRQWGYRGVFLDNMTRYPWIRDTSQLPAGLFSTWYAYLTDFCDDLRTQLPTVRVVVNSMGIGGSGINDLPLYGPDCGRFLMPHVNGGALMESFHCTAWRFNLDTIISIMKYMRDNNKIFLAGTHFAQGVDPALAGNFGLEPPRWESGAYPPPATFYRMQTSYLARFLLVSAGSQPFGYSFQPGEWLDSYVPYYKPWDENTGTPSGEYTYDDASHCFIREFSLSRVYVNGSETDPTTVAVPAGWYYYPYAGATRYGVRSIRASSDTSLTLNRMEGIVIFKTSVR